jgi:hypothetical protein
VFCYLKEQKRRLSDRFSEKEEPMFYQHKKGFKLVVISISLLMISACALATGQTVTDTVPVPTDTVPIPTDNSPGEIRGIALDMKSNRLTNVPLALAQVVEDETGNLLLVDENKWVYVKGTGIETKTDKSGEFILSEVPPGEYIFLVYTDSYHTLKDSQNSAIFTLSGGELLDVGQVSIWNE